MGLFLFCQLNSGYWISWCHMYINILVAGVTGRRVILTAEAQHIPAARAQRAQNYWSRAKMKRRAYLFIVVLFSAIPGLLARSSGAPREACNDLLPQHGATSQPSNEGYFILSEAIDNGYTPGRQYLGTLIYCTYTRHHFLGVATLFDIHLCC